MALRVALVADRSGRYAHLTLFNRTIALRVALVTDRSGRYAHLTLVNRTMALYVALVTDRSGRYALVWGNARNWSQFHDQLEDAGCEVIDAGCEVIEDQIHSACTDRH